MGKFTAVVAFVKKKTLGNSFSMNTVIYLISILGSKALTFLLVPFYTSYLSPEEYGNIDLITTTVALIMPLCTLGLDEAVFRYCMSSRHDRKNVIMTCLLTYFFSCCCLLPVLYGINYAIDWQYIWEMYFLLCSTGLFSLALGIVRAIGSVMEYSMIGIIQSAAALLLNIINIKYLEKGVEGYLSSYIGAYLLGAILSFCFIKVWKYANGKFDRQQLKEILQYSLPLIPTAISWWIMMSSDRYIVSYYLGTEENGLYSVANKVPTILQTVIMAVKSVWQIEINKIYEKGTDSLGKYFEKMLECSQTVGFIMGGIAIILSPYIMRLIAQKDFYAGWIYTPILIISVVFIYMSAVVTVLYGAFKKNSGSLYSALLGAGINIGLNFLLVQRYGTMGVAISTSIAYGIATLYKLADTQKFIQYKVKWFVIAGSIMILSLLAFARIYLDFYYQLGIFIVLILVNINGIREITELCRGKLKGVCLF